MKRINLNIDTNASKQDIARDVAAQLGFLDIARELAGAIKRDEHVEVYRDEDVFVVRFEGGCMVNERSTGIGDSACFETHDLEEAAERWRTGDF